tara:strand:- start:521 stop:838 length:318 start_codon:yes stop_codon:yes gene_type:complete
MRLFTATFNVNGLDNDVTVFGESVDDVVEQIMEHEQLELIENGVSYSGDIEVVYRDIPLTPENMETVARGIGGWQLHNIYLYRGLRFMGRVAKRIPLTDIQSRAD